MIVGGGNEDRPKTPIEKLLMLAYLRGYTNCLRDNWGRDYNDTGEAPESWRDSVQDLLKEGTQLNSQ